MPHTHIYPPTLCNLDTDSFAKQTAKEKTPLRSTRTRTCGHFHFENVFCLHCQDAYAAKCWYSCTKAHGVITQQTTKWIVLVSQTSSPMTVIKSKTSFLSQACHWTGTSQLCCPRSRSSGKWRWIFKRVFADVSKNRCAFISRPKQSDFGKYNNYLLSLFSRFS